MDKESKSGCGQADGNETVAAAEALLRAEIGFWRDLLSESRDSLPSESVERIRQALALAEHRYLQLQAAGRARDVSNGFPTWTRSPLRGSLH